MDPLSHVTIAWSVIGSAAALLGLLHLARGLMDGESVVDPLFTLTAFCFVGVAYTELRSMYAQTPEEWAFWVRWCYLPLTGMIVALVLFVRSYLGTDRAWLAAAVIGLRLVILGINFAHDPLIAFNRVDSLARIPFLGDTVSVVGQAETSEWQWLGTLATILLVAYVLDASVRLWRRGGAEEWRRAAVMGGAILVYAALGGIYVQLVIWRIVTLPLLITPTFAMLLLAMAYELSRDMLRASRLARELQQIRHRLELAADAADLGLWEWNSRTNRVWATQQAREMFGFPSPAPASVDEWMSRIHPDDVTWIRAASESALASSGEQVAEFRVCLPDGPVRWVAAHGRAEHGNGSGTLMRGVIRDISEQRRAQDETHELRRELTHAGRVSLLGQLSSALAHELSQPLGAILRNTEAAEIVLDAKSPDIGELKAIIADIHRDDRRAGEVIDRLRALLKRREMDLQPLAVDALLQDVISLIRVDAASRHVTVDCAVEPALPLVAGDRVHLSQVLLNLIINGMDAVMDREPGRRRVSVRGRRTPESGIDIAVADSGPGIPADNLARVFEPFYSTKSAGMGFGLSISRTIVEAHGGRLTADNAPDEGAIFTIILPVAGSSAQ